MAINFPDSPSTGETFQQADRAWQWDGEKWKSTGTTSSSTVGATVVFEGSTADAFETTLAATDPTADRTITLPNASGTVAFTSDLSSYAPLASPALTGNPTAPTQSSSDNSTKIATTAYADAAGGGGTSIADADADTKIQVEEGSDDDTIRFDVAGTQVATMTADGLLFGTDTASANAMDDYEEGLWTAAFTCGTSGTIAPNTSYDTMNYTKIGRLVNVSGNVDGFTVSSPQGSLTMTGLPFAIADTAERSDRGCFSVTARGLVSAEDNIFGIFDAGSGLIINYGNGGVAGGGAHMATLIDAGSYIRVNATYMAAT